MKMNKQDGETTWAFFSVALFRFLQIRARSSCILCFSDHLPSSLLGSTTASHTAFAPRLPIPNLAVNWKYKALVIMMVMTFLTLGFLFDCIEITNCRAESSKVGFNDGVVTASLFQSSNS